MDKHTNCVAMMVLFLILISPLGTDLSANPQESSHHDYHKNLNWLISMVKTTTHKGQDYALVQSYETLKDRCWIYDQALAVIVFSATGRVDLATKILNTLKHIQNPDGSFFFSYHIPTLTPTSQKKYTGTIAWVVMAANLYRKITRDPSYNYFTWKILQWLKNQQIINKKDPRFGGLSLGVRNDAFSMEHNLDSYSAFYFFGGKDAKKTAKSIKNFILQQLYFPKEKRFLTGYKDYSKYLDCQSWAILSFGQKYSFLLKYIEDNFQVLEGQTEQQQNIKGFFERRAPNAPVWSEGTEGAALAYIICDQRHKGDYYHQQVQRMTGKKGGIAYATRNTFDFSTSPSVAGTSWFLFYEMTLNPFKPNPKTLRNIRRFFRALDRQKMP